MINTPGLDFYSAETYPIIRHSGPAGSPQNKWTTTEWTSLLRVKKQGEPLFTKSCMAEYESCIPLSFNVEFMHDNHAVQDIFLAKSDPVPASRGWRRPGRLCTWACPQQNLAVLEINARSTLSGPGGF